MYSPKHIWQKLKLLQRLYHEFMAEHPSVNKMTHSVVSSVATYYLTVAMVDSSSERLINNLTHQVDEFKEQRKKDAEEYVKLNDQCAKVLIEAKKMEQMYYEVNRELIMQKLLVAAAKKDLKHSFCIYRCETFSDSDVLKIEKDQTLK